MQPLSLHRFAVTYGGGITVHKSAVGRIGFAAVKSRQPAYVCNFSPARNVFTQTGHWESKLTLEKKKEVEEYWRPRLTLEGTKKPGTLGKYYVLSMFPYPSGKLHMGHVRVYAISDAMARYRRMQGFDVIHPMGWDAFGLPAENAAIEQQMPPHLWTQTNIAHMKKQLQNMGFAFDWDREIRTCDSSYYKWTQYIFLLLWKAGLVYRKEAFVNWDPVDKTVLANEQVDENGCSWRSGAIVEKRLLKQWFIRTSHYATALRDGLKDVPHWRDIVDLQQFWIGETNGNWVTFDLLEEKSDNVVDTVKIFTKNPIEMMAVAFVSILPTHELCMKYHPTSDGDQKLNIRSRNPFNGDIVPVYRAADSSVFDNNCEIRPGVPALNESDKDFARRHSLIFREVVLDEVSGVRKLRSSGRFSDLTVDEAQTTIIEYGIENGFVSSRTSSRMTDWLISRQRYWGTPIPMVHCKKCGEVPVSTKELPVDLPVKEEFAGRGEAGLDKNEEWQRTECPKCGGAARRETDTMDTFVDSSWYFLRYLDPHNQKEPFSRSKAFEGMPVDLYIGGKEHALMHLFYARFMGYFLHSQGLIPEPEPFKQLLAQGFIMGRSYKTESGRYLKAGEVDKSGSVPVLKGTQEPVIEKWEKMSKSRFNGLDPDEAVAEYGVDATRLFMLGNISPRSHRKWDPELFIGLLKWQQNLWAIVSEYIQRNEGRADSIGPSEPEPELEKHNRLLWDSRNYYLKGKVPSSMAATSAEYRKTLEQVIVMSFPFAPHFSAELWTGIQSVARANAIAATNVWEVPWPQLDYSYDLDLLVQLCDDEIGTLKVPRPIFDSLTKGQAIKMTKDLPELTKYLRREVNSDHVHFSHHPEYEAVINFRDISAGKLRKEELKAKKASKKMVKKDLAVST